MYIKSLRIVGFSPTGTTKAVLQNIAHGISVSRVRLTDVTKPEARESGLSVGEDELLVVASPVYMGRVPAIFREWLQKVQVFNAPTACVVVFGNRMYGNALLELADIITSRGGITIAGAAFIGEHSFSHAELPTAENRPNFRDISKAELFGEKIHQRIKEVDSWSDFVKPDMPGSKPYGGVTDLWDVDFIEVSDKCLNHGVCATICPVGAINPEDTKEIDIKKCISCCACIKNCPENARSIKPGKVKDAAIRLNKLFYEPKEPEFYL